MLLFVLYVLLLDLFSVLFRRIWKSGSRKKENTVIICAVCGNQTFLDISETAWTFALFQYFWKCDGLCAIWIYTSGYSDKCRSGFFIILSGFSLSLVVEVIQLITKVGCFDVDDMILNTAWGSIGYVLFAVCELSEEKNYGKKI